MTHQRVYRGDLDIRTRLREDGPMPSLNRISADRRDAAAEIDRLERDLAAARAEAASVRAYNAGMLVIEQEKDAEIATYGQKLCDAYLEIARLKSEIGAEVERLRARVEFLEGTLQPFSDAAADAEGYNDDRAVGCDPAMELSIEIDEGAFGPLKVIHLRRARAAVNVEQGAEPK